MEIQNIKYHQSFGMAWRKTAKPLLSKVVSNISNPQKQGEAVNIINYLEKNSINHEIFQGENFLFASKTAYEGEHFREFFSSPKSFFKRLKQLKSFIDSDNVHISKIKQQQVPIRQKLNFLTKKSIFDAGIKVCKEDMTNFLTDMIKYFDKYKISPKKQEKIISQLKRTDKKAQQENINIIIRSYNNGFIIRKNNKVIVSYDKNCSDKEKMFKVIEKFVDKQIKKTKNLNKKETAKYKKEIRSVEKKIKRQEIKKAIIKKLTENPIFKNFIRIKENILEPIKQKEIALQNKQKKEIELISQKLDI